MSFDPNVLLWIAAVLGVALGLAGLVLPGLSGAPVLFAGLLAAAAAEEFAYVGAGTLIALGFMALLTYPVDLAARG